MSKIKVVLALRIKSTVGVLSEPGDAKDLVGWRLPSVDVPFFFVFSVHCTTYKLLNKFFLA